jgi:hypothetical protein
MALFISAMWRRRFGSDFWIVKDAGDLAVLETDRHLIVMVRKVAASSLSIKVMTMSVC